MSNEPAPPGARAENDARGAARIMLGPAVPAPVAMGCFCGCPEYEASPNGFRIGCVRCSHGPQNHSDEFRRSARGNEKSSQKRDADFG